jgi:hypothetical protein
LQYTGLHPVSTSFCSPLPLKSGPLKGHNFPILFILISFYLLLVHLKYHFSHCLPLGNSPLEVQYSSPHPCWFAQGLSPTSPYIHTIFFTLGLFFYHEDRGSSYSEGSESICHTTWCHIPKDSNLHEISHGS